MKFYEKPFSESRGFGQEQADITKKNVPFCKIIYLLCAVLLEQHSKDISVPQVNRFYDKNTTGKEVA